MTLPISFVPAAPSVGDRGLGRGGDLVIAHLARQKAFDDRDLVFLLLRQLGAVALPVERDRFAPLLDHALQHAQDLGIGDAGRIAGAARRDVAVFQAGEDRRTVDSVRVSFARIAAFSRSVKASRNIRSPGLAAGLQPTPFDAPRQFCRTYF